MRRQQPNLRRLYVVAAVIAVVGLAAKCDSGTAPVDASLYPAPWQEDPNLKIGRTLVAEGISGCGEYKYRQHRTAPLAYLVHCTRDGATWRAYLVDIGSGSVSGPHRISIQD